MQLSHHCCVNGETAPAMPRASNQTLLLFVQGLCTVLCIVCCRRRALLRWWKCVRQFGWRCSCWGGVLMLLTSLGCASLACRSRSYSICTCWQTNGCTVACADTEVAATFSAVERRPQLSAVGPVGTEVVTAGWPTAAPPWCHAWTCVQHAH